LKIVILAGGVGSRLSEETEVRPKPMVEIGGQPILWHIMMHYSFYGFNEFVLALGYKGEYIKKYFLEYCALQSSITVKFKNRDVLIHDKVPEDWTVDLIDTGLRTETGGRMRHLMPFLGNETFMMTLGDGVSDVNLKELIKFHKSHGKLATVTAVRPIARFGHLELDGDKVCEFTEKPQTKEGWINGAFFVLEPGIFDYIKDDKTQWAHEPMEQLAKDGQLMAYQHTSFWQCMDTLRDRLLLQQLWDSGNPPWKIWS